MTNKHSIVLVEPRNNNEKKDSIEIIPDNINTQTRPNISFGTQTAYFQEMFFNEDRNILITLFRIFTILFWVMSITVAFYVNIDIFKQFLQNKVSVFTFVYEMIVYLILGCLLYVLLLLMLFYILKFIINRY